MIRQVIGSMFFKWRRPRPSARPSGLGTGDHWRRAIREQLEGRDVVAGWALTRHGAEGPARASGKSDGRAAAACATGEYLRGGPYSLAWSVPRDIEGASVLAVGEQTVSLWYLGPAMRDAPVRLALFNQHQCRSIRVLGDDGRKRNHVELAFVDGSEVVFEAIGGLDASFRTAVGTFQRR